MKHRTIWIVLPAYNEEAGLPLLLRRIDESLTDEGFNYQVVHSPADAVVQAIRTGHPDYRNETRDSIRPENTRIKGHEMEDETMTKFKYFDCSARL